ncbi:MAG: tRNA pseudouridine(55) synthase TruB [Alphaproteobacteria bacterium]|nr:tRNA pseudouridine(55) synthase TruB [Alphaproteobacteria bacterium]
MARSRKGRPIHGWLVIDKPSGLTSSRVVGIVKRITGAAKAGHAGTLDPIATGILPLALGEATKTVPYLFEAGKRYRFTLRWGEARTTDDCEGDVSATSAVRPTVAQIEAALPRFIGSIEQVPPRYSAIKVEGARAYDLARADVAVDLAPRVIRIDAFRLIERADGDHAVFEVACGKGAYMRSLARDLAEALGTVGHVAALRRLQVGPFTEADAISLDFSGAQGHSPAPLLEHLLPVETALDDIPALAVTGHEASLLRQGQPVPVFRKVDLERLGRAQDGDTVCATSAGKPVALTRLDQGRLCPVRVLNL